MRSRPSGAKGRAFSVADGLVLIGALAFGLALVRGWSNPRWCTLPSFPISTFSLWTPQPQNLARRIVYATSVGVSWTIPFAMTLTVALLVLRLRSPRPSTRRIACQPGAVACASALAAIAFRLCDEAFLWLMGYLTRPQSWVHLPSPPFMRYDNPGYHPPAGQWVQDALLERFPTFISPPIAVAVAVGWCVLGMSGRWRPEAGWIDRSGRCLGFYWIALGIVLSILDSLSMFMITA